MNKALLIVLFAIIKLSLANAQGFCSNPLRFSEQPVFTDTQIGSQLDVVYGNAINWQGQSQNLTLDVYYPKLTEDTMALRPFILYVHGGGLITGDKTDWTLDCQQLAKRGYVVATINYRLGLTSNCNVDPLSENKASYRAIQDTKAALRFAVSNAAQIGIDTTHMFIAGGSAGAVTALGAIYLSQAEWDAFSPSLSQQLGPLNFSGNSLTNSYSLKGVANHWGAIGKNYINVNEMLPMVSFHGDEDPTVGIDSSLAIRCNDTIFGYGSRAINALLINAGVCADLTVKIGDGHGVYNITPAQKEFRINRIACFFKSVMCNTCTNFYSTDSIPANCSTFTGSDETPAQQQFSIYPNPSAENFTLSFVNASAKTVTLINAVGQVLRTLTTTDKQLTLSVTTPGMYFVRVQQGAKVWSEKIVKN